jgi:hypothetical protein
VLGKSPKQPKQTVLNLLTEEKAESAE